MFPLEIRLKKRFHVIESELEENNEILHFFKQEFINRKADNVRIENNEVRFDNNFFKLINNWNIMVPVDKGILAIKKENRSEIVIEYLFSLKIILILSGIAGIIIAIFSETWTTGLFAFLWLGGMNWVIAIIRHSIMFGDLNTELKEKILK
jgi:hypothetical protein